MRAEAIDRIGSGLAAPPLPGRLRTTALPAHEPEALWAVHDAVRAARDRQARTERLHRFLLDITEYTGHTPGELVGDLQRIQAVQRTARAVEPEAATAQLAESTRNPSPTTAPA